MVRDVVMGRSRVMGRVRVWVRVTEGLVRAGVGVGVTEGGVGVEGPIGNGIRIAIQASSSLLLPDPRMSAAKAALGGGAVGVRVKSRVRVGVRVGARVRVWVGVMVGISVRAGVGVGARVMVVKRKEWLVFGLLRVGVKIKIGVRVRVGVGVRVELWAG